MTVCEAAGPNWPRLEQRAHVGVASGIVRGASRDTPRLIERPCQALVLELLLEARPDELVALALAVGLEDGAVFHDLKQHGGG